MKKWLFLAAALTAAGLLARLPHPSRDIAKLKPVRAVYLYMDHETLCIETDTGDSGSGRTLTDACGDLKSKADGEIYLDTAEFLLLAPDVSITQDFFTLLRPDCRVVCTSAVPDLKTVTDYLSAHTPKMTLTELRASHTQH